MGHLVTDWKTGRSELQKSDAAVDGEIEKGPSVLARRVFAKHLLESIYRPSYRRVAPLV